MSGVETTQTGEHREDVFLNGRHVGYVVRMLEGLPLGAIMWGFGCPDGGPIMPFKSRDGAIQYVVGAVLRRPEGNA